MPKIMYKLPFGQFNISKTVYLSDMNLVHLIFTFWWGTCQQRLKTHASYEFELNVLITLYCHSAFIWPSVVSNSYTHANQNALLDVERFLLLFSVDKDRHVPNHHLAILIW